MTAKQLLYFVTIAETGSFTLAAEKLNLSQPPLSKQIMLLENELESQLLIRSSRRIKLTESGVLLYNRAKDILRMMDRTAADMRNLAGNIGGTVRLGVAHSAGDLVLNHKLSAFLKECPNCTLDLHHSTTDELINLVKKGELDAAIVQVPFNTDDLECRYLSADTYACVGHAGFFPPQARSISVGDLLGTPLIFCRCMERQIVDQFEQEGLPYHCLCRTCDLRTALMMADSGHGVAIIPKNLAEVSVHIDKTRVIPLESPNISFQLAFIFKQNTHRTKLVETLANLF